MANPIKFFYATEAQILALIPSNVNWIERAFYYPEDKSYFYQLLNGVMKKYGDGIGSGVGITLNDRYIAGVKTWIEPEDVLVIPANYDYNTYTLDVDGVINIDGQINFLKF